MRLGAVWEGDTLQAVAPLLIRVENRWGRTCRVLRFWANPYSNRANFVLHAEGAPEIARVLIGGLEDMRNEWDVADLGPTVLDETTTRVIQNELKGRRAAIGISVGYSSPYRALPDQWNDVETSLGSSYRQSVRRKVRKAEKIGAVVTFSEASSEFQKVLEISKGTWQHTDGTGIGSTDSIRGFYQRVVKWSEERGSLQLAFLEVKGEPVAFELNLVEKDTVYNLKVGYELEMRDLSPGAILRYHVLKNAVERGVREFDFLGEAEPYKLRWASGVREHGNLLWFTRRFPWIAVHVAQFRARPLVKKHLPLAIPLLRRILRPWGGR